MFPTGVDAFPFWFVTGIFAVIFGNLIYKSSIVYWLMERERRREVKRMSNVRHSCRNESLAKAPSRVSTEESEVCSNCQCQKQSDD